MLLEKEIFNNLCPSYQKAVKELDEKYAALSENDFVPKLELFREFFHRFLMGPQLWDKVSKIFVDYKDWIGLANCTEELEFHNKINNEHSYDNYISYYQFYDSRSIYSKQRNMLLHKKSYAPFSPYTLKEIEALLICPQKYLDDTFKYYDKFSRSPIPKELIQKFQNAKKLYNEIVEAENDQIKWFNLLIQCQNEDYVCENIDVRLGQNLNNLELWSLYFDYLRNIQNTKRLMHLYSRYCRYFLDDLKMKTEYKEAVKKYGPVKVFWKNAFDFETAETNPDQLFNKNDKIEPKSLSIPKPSFQNYEKQIFSFPKTIMSYIINFGNPNILHNLHKSCKYFFVLRPYPVCHRLRCSHGEFKTKFYGQSLDIFVKTHDIFGKHSVKESNIIFDRKIIISNCLDGDIYFSKIHQCNAKYIECNARKMSFKELVFLVGHGNVDTLNLNRVQIFNEDNIYVPLEEILKLLPKITVFQMEKFVEITLKTFEILSTLQFTNKFHLFSLQYLSYLEPYGFCDFLKKTLNSNSRCCIGFKNEFENLTEIKNITDNELKNFWPEQQKPSISFDLAFP